MSIYPVIPITQFYNNAVTYDPRAAKVELGKGGVLDRSRIHFFNNTRKNYSISAVLKDKDTLQNFLELNRGKPFEFRYDGSNSAGLYICKTWSWDWVVYVDGVSGVWNFSATFEQVFRPGWVSDTTGLGTLTLGAITVTGTGLISINPSGSGSLIVPIFTANGSGEVIQSNQGSGALSWPVIQVSGSGSLTNNGSGAIAWPTVIVSGTGTVSIMPDGEGTLETSPITVSGTGSITHNGSGTLTTPDMIVSGSGSLTMTGSGSLETSNVTVSGSGNVVTGSTLLDGLLAWYSMGEASGNALDSHTGGYTLTQSGTVGSVEGKVGNARSFGGSNFFTESGSQFNFGNTTFYGAQWVYSNNTSTAIIHGVWDDGPGANRQWFLFQDATRYRFGITSDGLFAAGNGITVAWGSNFAAATWYFVEWYHNASTDQIGIAVNGGTFVTTSFNKGVYVGETTPYRMGRGAGTSPLQWSGRLDEVAIWNRMLTTDERTTLYNAGAGMAYPG